MKPRWYNVYVAGRIDISARVCTLHTHFTRARSWPQHAGLSPRNDISPEADRMKSWHSLGDAFGKIRLFKVSSRYLQLQQFNIVNDKNPPAIPCDFTFYTIFIYLFFLIFRVQK